MDVLRPVVGRETNANPSQLVGRQDIKLLINRAAVLLWFERGASVAFAKHKNMIAENSSSWRVSIIMINALRPTFHAFVGQSKHIYEFFVFFRKRSIELAVLPSLQKIELSVGIIICVIF